MEKTVEIMQCENCNIKEGAEQHGCKTQIYNVSYFQDPWTDKTFEYNLCEDCEQSARGEDFEHCQVCERDIAMTTNGMRMYFVCIYGDTEEDEQRREAYKMFDIGHICIKCLQEHRFKNGLLPCEVKNGKSLAADFYNYEELRKNGYSEYEKGIFVRNERECDYVQSTMQKLMKKGKKVILDLERSGLGLEGYVGIWIK